MNHSRSHILPFCLLLFSLLVACVPTVTPSPVEATPVPTSPPQPASTRGPGRCGDGSCTGPETAANCPADCTTAPGATVEPTAVSNGAEALLFFTTMTHLEGNFADDQNEQVFLRHVEQLQYGLSLANEYGARLTIESEEPFARACEIWGVNALQQVRDLGHGVGTHADVGFSSPTMSVDELTQALAARKALVDALVGPENNRGTSGGGGPTDWVLAAHAAGFDYIDGVVGMHYLAMPLESRPDPSWTDEYIRSQGYHIPIPPDFEDRIYPRMLQDAQDLQPDEAGILLFSPGGIGRLDSMVEGDPQSCPQMRCDLTSEDVDAVVAQIEEADRIRDPDRVAKLTLYIPLHLFDPQNEDGLREFFARMADLEEQGVITWATQGEVLDAYGE